MRVKKLQSRTYLKAKAMGAVEAKKLMIQHTEAKVKRVYSDYTEFEMQIQVAESTSNYYMDWSARKIYKEYDEIFGDGKYQTPTEYFELYNEEMPAPNYVSDDKVVYPPQVVKEVDEVWSQTNSIIVTERNLKI